MTPERQNEIWAMLDADTQEWIKGQYEEILEDIADYKAENTDNGSPIMENRAIGQKQMLVRLFGKHNLIAQAEEGPKEPKYKVGDKVLYKGKAKIVADIRYGVNKITYTVTTLTNQSPIWLYEDELESYTEPKGESNGENKSDCHEGVISELFKKIEKLESDLMKLSSQRTNYAAYRLDLVKEIAKVMLDKPNFYGVQGTPKIAIELADEIVKRLKETEE